MFYVYRGVYILENVTEASTEINETETEKKSSETLGPCWIECKFLYF